MSEDIGVLVGVFLRISVNMVLALSEGITVCFDFSARLCGIAFGGVSFTCSCFLLSSDIFG
jgi:hypothetical protein